MKKSKQWEIIDGVSKLIKAAEARMQEGNLRVPVEHGPLSWYEFEHDGRWRIVYDGRAFYETKIHERLENVVHLAGLEAEAEKAMRAALAKAQEVLVKSILEEVKEG